MGSTLTVTSGTLVRAGFRAGRGEGFHRMIKNIVFDMGGVLINFDAERYAARFAPNPADRALLRRELFRSVEWIQMDRGSITDEQAATAVCSRLPRHLHAAVRDILDNWHQDIPPMDGICDLVAELKAEGYGIYLLSNTCARFHRFRRPSSGEAGTGDLPVFLKGIRPERRGVRLYRRRAPERGGRGPLRH